MDMMGSFGVYGGCDVTTAGLYNDAAMTNLPRTIAMMNGGFMGMPATVCCCCCCVHFNTPFRFLYPAVICPY